MQSNAFSRNKFNKLKSRNQAKKIADISLQLLEKIASNYNNDNFILATESLSKLAQLYELLGWYNQNQYFNSVEIPEIASILKESATYNTSKVKSFEGNSRQYLMLINLLYGCYIEYIRKAGLGPVNLAKMLPPVFDKQASINTRFSSEADNAELTRSQQTVPYQFCLWNLRSAHNAGAILRSLDCFGLQGIILAGHTPGPDHKAFCSAAMGCESWIPIINIQDDFAELKNLLKPEQKIIALETDSKAKAIQNFAWPAAGGLVLVGNEELGLPKSVLDIVDHTIVIPHFGLKKSMNVASASAITAYEIRQFFTTGADS